SWAVISNRTGSSKSSGSRWLTGAVRLNLIRPLVKARLSADSFGSFVLGLCFGHEEFLLLRMIKRQRVVRYLRFSYPDSGQPLARRDSRKALRSSPSCHTTDVRHRRAHPPGLSPARKSPRPEHASPFPS